MLIDLLLLAVGIAMLSVGGDSLIRGAVATARRLGISPLLTGLVIVGFGTSAPELVVSIDAAFSGSPDIAIGNVVGSNISNTLLILGISALITPMVIKPLALRRDGLVVVGASVLFIILAYTGQLLSRIDALILLLCLGGYLIWAYQSEKDHDTPESAMHEAEAGEISKLPHSVMFTAVAVTGGLLLMIAGSRLLLTGAVSIATDLGIPEAVIGLTLVAVGTSLPELSIAVIAAIRKHADVAVGNILGSNIFNLLAILGTAALVHPLPVAGRILLFDQWFMLGSALLLMIFLYTGMRLSRAEGGMLLTAYG
ncbi:MAG: calcium/sodium antiporter, partial [Gammaproteobacteria bacterium]